MVIKRLSRKVPIKGRSEQKATENVRLKSAVAGAKSVNKTKNEPVVGRNIFRRA
jgi:hypothetical protein